MRREQKVGSDPNNKFWAEDTSKFGYKMMMKMGWTEGKGLGKDENGNTKHIVVDKKNDNTGIGLVDKNSYYTEHMSTFNDILKRLNQTSTTEEKTSTPVDTLSTVVPASGSAIHVGKNRVIYSKRIKAKTVANYTEAQKDEIFGKKSLQEKETKIKLFGDTNNGSSDNGENGHLIVTAKQNIHEYFQQKIKQRDGNADEDIQESSSLDTTDSEKEKEKEKQDKPKKDKTKEEKQKKKEKKSKKRKLEEISSSETAEQVPEKKEKKSKKDKKEKKEKKEKKKEKKAKQEKKEKKEKKKEKRRKVE